MLPRDCDCVRGCAADGDRLPAARDQPGHDSNLATTGRIAVGVTHPRDNFATQFKGTTLEARLARDDESAFVRARLEAYADVLDRIGVPRRVARSLAHWPAFAVTMRVEQTFDQTPGPNAGSPVR